MIEFYNIIRYCVFKSNSSTRFERLQRIQCSIKIYSIFFVFSTKLTTFSSSTLFSLSISFSNSIDTSFSFKKLISLSKKSKTNKCALYRNTFTICSITKRKLCNSWMIWINCDFKKKFHVWFWFNIVELFCKNERTYVSNETRISFLLRTTTTFSKIFKFDCKRNLNLSNVNVHLWWFFEQKSQFF